MPLSQADRIAFSLKIVSSDDDIKAIKAAQAAIAVQIAKLQALDTANANLMNSPNLRINAYQLEFNSVDGNTRTVIVEQNIIDAANHVLNNDFFPNNTTTAVPSLSAQNNVWAQVVPFALGFGVGKTYIQTYLPTVSNEDADITAIQGFITSLGANTNIQNTTGQKADTILTNPIITFTALHTTSASLIAAVTAWQLALLAQAAAITAIVDPNVTNQTQNTAALANITVALAAITIWLALPAFTPMSGSTTGTAFNATNPATLLPHPQLYSANLATLSAAVSARAAFVVTRTAQINTILGSITQNVLTGAVTGSGLYFQRYGFLSLRLNALSGSLSQLAGLTAASNAQNSIIASIIANKATYMSVVPTTLLAAPGNGTKIANVVDASFYSPGDIVYLTADNQQEIQRSIESITNNMVILNDIVPAKFRPVDHARMYKDLT